ncbi:MAG: hypothetical protein IIC00_04770, partial [Planctomycetes bacterium]|nr:hypothetical protein [Planctomycetota bacterium]
MKLNIKSAFPVLFVAVLLTAFGGERFAVAQGGATLECDWNPNDPHKMHWPQLPDLSPAGMDVDMSLLFLADDFMCTATGPINDIHIWASFHGDVLPPNGPGSLIFEITIYSDIPATASNWSMPGDILWSRTFSPNEYSVRKLDDSPEGWYDPAKELYLPNNHTQAYQYNFCIEEEPFMQEEGTIYWLGVKELASADANYKFGWKTTTYILRWNDDAVFFLAGNLVSFPLTYPRDHEHAGESLDLAFVITESPPQPTTRPVSPTQCPVVLTQCPAAVTQCPPIATMCPPVNTQCPAALSICPPVPTQCTAVETVCPPVETLCPAVDTKCPPVITRCPPAVTLCSLIHTICQDVETQCPAVETTGPPVV